jgi:C4-dicarboxylate-specific signal transduction histidine kinase
MKIIKKINPTPQVFGDQYQIEQVLVNLITNASDAIEETGNDGVLTISTEYKNNTVITYVRDSGPGIPINSQEKIFTPFFTTKPIGKGTGLGLSISRNIIKDHKGDLLVTNHPDGGAQFTIVLPSKQKANL